MMKPLIIGDIEAKLPIIQGGMGIGVSLSSLASSVANVGGIGTISAVIPGFREKDLLRNYRQANIRGLRNEIRKAKSLTKGLLAVNIMVALTNYVDMVKTAIEEKVDFIISGAGLPLGLPQFIDSSTKTKLIPIVSTERAADLIIRKWHRTYNYIPDAIILESPLSGGHQGVKENEISLDNYKLDNQLSKVLLVVEKYQQLYGKTIPVIVAGGIFSGLEIKKYIERGASGAQLGTRFIATEECDADIKFKQKYIDCNSEDEIVVTKSPVGFPLRIIKNAFFDKIINGERKPKTCLYKCLRTCNHKEVPFCIAVALMNAQKGNVDEGILCSGASGHKINKLLSVKELINTIINEYEDE